MLEADVQGLMMPHSEVVAGIHSEAGPSGVAIGVHIALRGTPSQNGTFP